MELQNAERAPAEPAVADAANKSPSRVRARSASTHPPPAAEPNTSNPSHPPPHSQRSASAKARGVRSSSFSFGFLDEEQAERTGTGPGPDVSTRCEGLVIEGVSSQSQAQLKCQSGSESGSPSHAEAALAASSASSYTYKTSPEALSESESSTRLVYNKESLVELDVQPAPSSNSTTGSSAKFSAIDSCLPKVTRSSRSLKKPQPLLELQLVPPSSLVASGGGEAVPADFAREKPLSRKERKRQAKLLQEHERQQKQEALRAKAAATSAASSSSQQAAQAAPNWVSSTTHSIVPHVPVPFSTSSVRTVSSAAVQAVAVPQPPQPFMPSTAFSWPAPTSLNPNYFNMAASSFTMPTGAFGKQNALQPLQVPSSLSMLSRPISAYPVFPPDVLPQASAYYPTSSLSSSQNIAIGQPSLLPTATLPVPSTTEAAAARLVISDPTPPPCPVLPVAAVFANAHYYCRYCSCSSTCPSDWVAHWNNGAHQFNVQCARERLWNYRQPNWSLALDEYQLCGSFMRESTAERKMRGVHSSGPSRYTIVLVT